MSASTIILIGALVFVIFIDFIIKKRKKNNLAIEIKVDQNPNSSFERNTIIGMFLINVFLALGLLNADYLDSKWNSFYLDLTSSKIVEEEESFENFRMDFYKSGDIEKLNALIAKDPGFAEYYRLRADYNYIIEENFQQAITDYSQALNLGTVDSAGVYFDRTYARMGLKDESGAEIELEKATNIYEKKLNQDPTNPILLYKLGMVKRLNSSFYNFNGSKDVRYSIRSYSSYTESFDLLKRALINSDLDLKIPNDRLYEDGFTKFDKSYVNLRHLIYHRMMANYNINLNKMGYDPYKFIPDDKGSFSRKGQKVRYARIDTSDICNILRIAGEEGYSGPIDVYDFINKSCN